MNSVPHENRDDVAPTDGPDDEQQAATSEGQASADAMRLLSEHVPLTLLADLAQPIGPGSPEILEDEGLPEVAWWEHAEDE